MARRSSCTRRSASPARRSPSASRPRCWIRGARWPAPERFVAKVRLDSLLAERGLFESRSRAAAAVMAGEVSLAGRRASKAGQLVDPSVEIDVAVAPAYVSRGGVKLANALDRLGVPGEGRCCP